MSLLANIDYLAGTEGIVALMVDVDAPRIDVPEQSPAFRGLSRWQPILRSATQLLAITGETSIRVVIARHTLILQKEQEQVVGVVFPTGHAVAKSLRRMIRRMAKRQRISPRKPREVRPTREVASMQISPTSSHSQPMASSSFNSIGSRSSLPLAPRMNTSSR